MIFFFILPVWFVIVCAASVLFFFRATRWLGGYIISSATLSVLFSFVGSLAGLFGLGAAGHVLGAGDYNGLLMMGGYGIGLIAGGGFGAVAGAALVGAFHYLSWKKARAGVLQP